MERARAKINLSLRVLGRRDDGYHELATVMQTLTLGERVDVEARLYELGCGDRAQRGREPSWRVVLNALPRAARVPCDGRNTAMKAARAYMRRVLPDWIEAGGSSGDGSSIRRVRMGGCSRLAGVGILRGDKASAGGMRLEIAITIRKHIPVAAGLAGGSADAAAVLRALPRVLARLSSFGEGYGERSGGGCGKRGGEGCVEDCGEGCGTAAGLPSKAARISLPGESELREIAASVGADVPFCLLGGGAALARGIGDKLTSAEPLPAGAYVVLANPRFGVSAAEAYMAWDAAANEAVGALTGETAKAAAGATGAPAAAGMSSAIGASSAASASFELGMPSATASKPAAQCGTGATSPRADGASDTVGATSPRAVGASDTGGATGLAGLFMCNDLEAPVTRLHPVIAELVALLRSKGAAAAQMSGSGPTVFGLFSSYAGAMAACAAAEAAGCWACVCRPSQ